MIRPPGVRPGGDMSGADWTRRVFLCVTGAWAAALVASGVSPYDRATWLMEVLPVLIAWPVLHATRNAFALTTLCYILVGVHGLILIYGGAYTYARVPAGSVLQDWLGFERNPYDRIGHLAQGFVPAIVARELLIRIFRVTGRKFLFFLVTCIALAVSAFYELIEWWAAVALGQGAHEFLGTQGDEWDTQWDMFLALVGAMTAQIALARYHDRQIAMIEGRA